MLVGMKVIKDTMEEDIHAAFVEMVGILKTEFNRAFGDANPGAGEFGYQDLQPWHVGLRGANYNDKWKGPYAEITVSTVIAYGSITTDPKTLADDEAIYHKLLCYDRLN